MPPSDAAPIVERNLAQMTAFKKLALATLLATQLSGCYMQKFATEQPDVQLSDDRRATTKKFSVQERSWWLFNGLMPLISPDLDAIIKREAVGKPVKNLKITQAMTPADFILTYGLMAAWVTGVTTIYPTKNDIIYPSAIAVVLAFPRFLTVTIEGDVVNAKPKGPANDYTGDED